jgi:hypothetical protein
MAGPIDVAQPFFAASLVQSGVIFLKVVLTGKRFTGTHGFHCTYAAVIGVPFITAGRRQK